MGPPSYMRSVVDRNVFMRRISVHGLFCGIQGVTQDSRKFLRKTG